MSTRVPTAAAAAEGASTAALGPVPEVRLVGLGLSGRRPLLLARTKDRELVLYQAYQYHSPALTADQLKLRLLASEWGVIEVANFWGIFEAPMLVAMVCEMFDVANVWGMLEVAIVRGVIEVDNVWEVFEVDNVL